MTDDREQAERFGDRLREVLSEDMEWGSEEATGVLLDIAAALDQDARELTEKALAKGAQQNALTLRHHVEEAVERLRFTVQGERGATATIDHLDADDFLAELDGIFGERKVQEAPRFEWDRRDQVMCDASDPEGAYVLDLSCYRPEEANNLRAPGAWKLQPAEHDFLERAARALNIVGEEPIAWDAPGADPSGIGVGAGFRQDVTAGLEHEPARDRQEEGATLPRAALRAKVAQLIREDFDPAPPAWRDDNAEDIAEKILAAVFGNGVDR